MGYFTVDYYSQYLLGYNLVQQENFSEKSKRYLHDISVLDNTYLIDSDIDVAKRTISMIYSGYGPSEED